MKALPRIVLVEDQLLFRQILAQYLRCECGCKIAGEALDGAQGLKLCLRLKPDAALIDLQLPVMNGLTLAERLHRQAPAIKLLALSARLDALTVHLVDRSPFMGYVYKGQPPAMLKAALAQVLAGQRSFSTNYLALRAQIAKDPNAFCKILSNREMIVLACVAQGATNEAIAEQMEISLRTVETHRYRIMAKLGISRATNLMKYARQQGFDPLTLTDPKPDA